MPKRNLIWIAVIVGAGVATVLFTRTTPQPDDPSASRFGPVIRAHEVLRHSVYPNPSDAKMQQGAVRGMVDTFDEYSTYIPPERAKSFRARLAGAMVCTGIVLADGPDAPAEILGSLPGSPADKAGIAPGEHVLAVDGNDVRGLPAGQVRGLLESPAQRSVVVTIADDAGRENVYKLARRAIDVESVVGIGRSAGGQWEYSLDPAGRLACIRVREFLPATPSQMQQALRELSGLAGLVLDLRDNPGGRIEAGYATANLFLREGAIFTQIDAAGRRRVHNASANGTWPDVPVIVLVNDRTASAAEIVAGSLQLHRRAVLIGTRTRGKGLVQSMIDLPDGMGLANVTTGEFFLGLDVPITRQADSEIWGVQPDIVLALSPQARLGLNRYWQRVSVAPTGEPRRSDESATAPTTEPANLAAAALAVDPQLAEAVRLFESPEQMRKILAGPAATHPAKMKASDPANRNP